MNYQKYIYEQKKKLKNNKSKPITTKEIKIHMNTSENDINVKAKNTRRILEEGNKVKISIVFKGRENLFREKGEEILSSFYNQLEDIASVSTPIKTAGNTSFMIISKK